VSQQIRRLERELGVDLFDRSGRHVRLTAAGARLLPHARDVLAAENRARAAMADLAGVGPAALRLGTSAGLGERLDRVLDTVARHEPHLQVELVSASVQERLDGVRCGRLDAAFVRAMSESPELRAVPVWNDELVVALPARHPLADAPEVALAEVAALPLRLTMRRNHPSLVDLVIGACRAAGFEPVMSPPSGLLADNLAAIGVGPAMWTVVYASQARQLHTPRVAFRPFSPPGLSIKTFLAVRRARPPALLELLLDACVQAAGDDVVRPSVGTDHDY
jgi:DNA-binding transcriptional LysR family regulator